jgi:hypothetical protein
MPLDSTLVRQAAAEVMDSLDANFGDQGSIAQDGQIVSVALIVAVEHSGGNQTTYDYSFAPQAAMHEGIGLLHVVLNDIASRSPS